MCGEERGGGEGMLASGKSLILYGDLANGMCVCKSGDAETESRFYSIRSEKVEKFINPFNFNFQPV